jgi:methyl-accepting chemotaxis protein
MPPTVKSLEERIDQLTEDFGELRKDVAVLTSRVDGAINLLDRIAAQMNQMSGQVTALVGDYAAFKADTGRTVAVVKWVGVFGAGVLFTVILSAFSLARSAGNLEATVQQQQKTLEEIRREVSEMHGKQK